MDKQDNQADLLAKARTAMEIQDAPAKDALLTEIIQALEVVHGDNQKEIAARLQELARKIETSGEVDKAMDFKQTTTAIMMRLSMERRRGKQALLEQPARRMAAPTSTFSALAAMPIKSSGSLFQAMVYLLIPTSNIVRSRQLYVDILNGRESWTHTDGHYPSHKLVAIALDSGPRMVLVQGYELSKQTPVFATAEFGAAAIHLEDNGFKRTTSLHTPKGPIQLFVRESGEHEQIGLIRSNA
ncbi:MAG: hypothetical protein K2X70_01730 [Candidatus Obscuribacterales bacterium]|nr:hypothetical protein [Candidatus Obscuribacterales bacterium]